MIRRRNGMSLLLIGGLLSLAGGAGAMGDATGLSDAVIHAARAIYQQDFEGKDLRVEDGQVVGRHESQTAAPDSGREPSAALRIDTTGKTTSVPADCILPKDAPAYQIFDTFAAEPGRLIVHFQPVELPEPFKDKVQEKDWADPRRRLDFRALVDLKPGGWQRHAVDLSRHVFEAITQEKVVFDPAGLRIKSIGFEANQPAEKGQQVLIDDVRLIALTPEAMQAHMQDRWRDARDRIQNLPQGSAARAAWQEHLRKAQELVTDSGGQGLTVAEYRKRLAQLDELALASRKCELPVDPSEPFAVGTETSLRRVSGRNALYPFRGAIGQEVRLDAAGNEYESFQIVVLPLAGDLKQVQVKASDLKQADGDGTIPARQVAVFRQIEQWIQPSLRTTVEQVGWTPDALLPVEGPLDVDLLQTLPLWVNLYVPADARPGEYRGQIRVEAKGTEPKIVPVVVKVRNFAIPKVGRFRTQGHFALNQLQEWYGQKYSPEVRKAFYRLMIEHRFTPTSQYSRMLSPVEEDIDWIMKEGGNVILIGGYAHTDLEPERIDAWYKWILEHGCIDQAIIYIGDETDDFERMRAKARTIRQKWPKLRIMVGGSKPRPELIGYCDVWDPITQGGSVYDFDARSTSQAVQRGEEVFWYTCIGPRQPYANVCNDDPLAAIRALWWQAWKYEVTGFEYWWFNYWGPNMELSKGEKPWPLSRTEEWNSRSYAWCNGDGLWVYPGPDGRPLSSNRFSVVRDAVEDWEVLFMLQRAVELAGRSSDGELASLVEQAKSILAVPAEITTDLTHWSQDLQVYLRYRAAMYDLLDDLRSRLGPRQLDDYTRQWIENRQAWLNEKFEQRVANTQPQG